MLFKYLRIASKTSEMPCCTMKSKKSLCASAGLLFLGLSEEYPRTQ